MGLMIFCFLVARILLGGVLLKDTIKAGIGRVVPLIA